MAKGKAKSKAKPEKVKGLGRRTSWFDVQTQTPLIEGYARQLKSFLQTMADGRVDKGEIKDQEARLVRLMREIEPKLDDPLHAKITELLCELTAYDIMQLTCAIGQARPMTQFRG